VESGGIAPHVLNFGTLVGGEGSASRLWSLLHTYYIPASLPA